MITRRLDVDADQKDLIELFETVFGYTVIPQMWAWKYRPPWNDDHYCWVARQDNKVIGYVGAVMVRGVVNGQPVPFFQLADVMVHPDYRKQHDFFGLASTHIFEEIVRRHESRVIYGFSNHRAFLWFKRTGLSDLVEKARVCTVQPNPGLADPRGAAAEIQFEDPWVGTRRLDGGLGERWPHGAQWTRARPAIRAVALRQPPDSPLRHLGSAPWWRSPGLGGSRTGSAQGQDPRRRPTTPPRGRHAASTRRHPRRDARIGPPSGAAGTILAFQPTHATVHRPPRRGEGSPRPTSICSSRNPPSRAPMPKRPSTTRWVTRIGGNQASRGRGPRAPVRVEYLPPRTTGARFPLATAHHHLGVQPAGGATGARASVLHAPRCGRLLRRA